MSSYWQYDIFSMFISGCFRNVFNNCVEIGKKIGRKLGALQRSALKSAVARTIAVLFSVSLHNRLCNRTMTVLCEHSQLMQELSFTFSACIFKMSRLATIFNRLNIVSNLLTLEELLFFFNATFYNDKNGHAIPVFIHKPQLFVSSGYVPSQQMGCGMS